MSAKQSPASSLGGAKSIERNPAAIWLSPICDDEAHHGEGRTWAAPAPAETCEDCSEPWVRYVREDLALPSPSPAIVKEAGEVEQLTGEMLFDAFMVGDVSRLTTTALPGSLRSMQSSYQRAWDDLAAALSASNAAQVSK